jgi:cbb3-type cytochrome oxidase subunit 1
MTSSASCNTRSPNPSSQCIRNYVIRLLGGLMFLGGALIMVYNLIQTVRSRTTEQPVMRLAPLAGLDPTLAVAGE